MLPSSADGPAECLDLLNLSFRCAMLDTVTQTPSYGAWLLDCDFGPAYRHHERVLKLLQWHRPPNRWRLKTPAHMFAIDALDAVYPDARFVITHRDPAKVMPSLASVETAVVRMYTGKADPYDFGRHCVEDWDHALLRAVSLHQGGPFVMSARSWSERLLYAACAASAATGPPVSAAVRRARRRGASAGATRLAASTPSTMSVTTSAKGRSRRRTDTTAPAG